MTYNVFIHNIQAIRYQPPQDFPSTTQGDPAFVVRDLLIDTDEGTVRLTLFARQVDALEVLHTVPRPDLTRVSQVEPESFLAAAA
ncbi:MAG: hypothetical protein IT487_12290 [Chromatiaceae bacterium]|nr:hypothetical protein [Chromatiaceae bacterium]